MKFAIVKIADILTEGPTAGKFSFCFEPDIDEIADSIKAVGLINPPTLRRDGDVFDVVCGFRRALACRNLGWEETDALVYEHEELSDEKALWFNLTDNAGKGMMSPMECAIGLNRFSEQGYDADRLVEEIAPKLGMPASRKYIEGCLRIPSLKTEILKALHDGSFGMEQAFCLMDIDAASRVAIFRVLRSCKANLNETRELISLIPDVAAIKNMSLTEYIESELEPKIKDESLSARNKLEHIRDLLTRSRFPRLTRAESDFDAAVEKMKLDKNCRIVAPRHFEGDDIAILVRGDNAEKLQEMFGRLASERAREEFQQLFSIIRGRDDS